MYKSRIQIWLVGLVVGIIISFFCSPSFVKGTYTLYTNTTDDFLKNDLTTETFFINAKSTYNKSNADIIIQSSSKEKISGYKKYENYLYSPIIMFINQNCTDTKNGFILKNDITYFNLKKLLVGLENDKTFQDIGFAKKVAEGPIVISIPDESNECYDEVRKLFLLTLDDKTSTVDEIEKRVDKLLKKCKKVSDPSGEMMRIAKNSYEHNLIFIGPEYYIKSDKHESNIVFNSTDKSDWWSVYPNKTCNVTYDVFVKNDKEKIFDKIKNNYRNIGLRSIDKPTISNSYVPDTVMLFDEG